MRRTMILVASSGTEVGLDVLHEASEGRVDWLIPPGPTRTDDIYADRTPPIVAEARHRQAPRRRPATPRGWPAASHSGCWSAGARLAQSVGQ